MFLFLDLGLGEQIEILRKLLLGPSWMLGQPVPCGHISAGIADMASLCPS
jgi:hypothetical protein